MEKKNRKNRKPLIVVAMLLMVALVVGMGAMTYSRYVSSFNLPAQQATAAKWGFVVTATSDDLFGSSYVKGTGNTAIVGDGVVIKGSTDTVAPGATGSMTIKISGTSEVLARLKFEADTTSTIAFDTYKPIKWTVNDGSTSKSDTDFDALMNGFTPADAIEPGASINKTYTISWEWAWSTEEATSIKDTIIGIKAADPNYANVKNILLADGNALSTQFTESTAAEDYEKITTQLAFTLKVTLEQVQA